MLHTRLPFRDLGPVYWATITVPMVRNGFLPLTHGPFSTFHTTPRDVIPQVEGAHESEEDSHLWRNMNPESYWDHVGPHCMVDEQKIGQSLRRYI